MDRVVVAAFTVGLLWVGGACDDSGSLVCPAGALLCGAQCSNVKGDPANCGLCGHVCAHGSICDLGTCTSAGFDAGPPAVAPTPTMEAGPADAKEAATAADSGEQE